MLVLLAKRIPGVCFLSELLATEIPRILPKYFCRQNLYWHQVDAFIDPYEGGEDTPYIVPDDQGHQPLPAMISMADVVH